MQRTLVGLVAVILVVLVVGLSWAMWEVTSSRTAADRTATIGYLRSIEAEIYFKDLRPYSAELVDYLHEQKGQSYQQIRGMITGEGQKPDGERLSSLGKMVLDMMQDKLPPGK